jgi:hypothetical protein
MLRVTNGGKIHGRQMVERRLGVVSCLQSILRGGISDYPFALFVSASSTVAIIAALSIPLSISVVGIDVGLKLLLGHGDCEAWDMMPRSGVELRR